MRLLLYTRPDCELCDAVSAIARQLGAQVQAVDITEDLELLQRYGTRIPVLRDPEGDRELDYPIDHALLIRWLDDDAS